MSEKIDRPDVEAILKKQERLRFGEEEELCCYILQLEAELKEFKDKFVFGPDRTEIRPTWGYSEDE